MKKPPNSYNVGGQTKMLKLLWRRVSVCAACAVLQSGCATRQAGLKMPGGSEFGEAQACRFGRIALGQPSTPASFSFQPAKGKLGSVKEALVDSAELGLSAPGAGIIASEMVITSGGWCDQPGGADPYFYAAVAGAVTGVTAIGAALAGPVVGAKGLIRSMQSVTPAELAEREAALATSLEQMAAQQPFHDALIRAGAERIRDGFISADPENRWEENAAGAADAVLEAQVDELRLERAGSTEGSYFLRIKTHARLLRAKDGVVCFAAQAEYRSGTALFLDWTLRGGVEGVAETGYRALARYYVETLLSGSTDSRQHQVSN